MITAAFTAVLRMGLTGAVLVLAVLAVRAVCRWMPRQVRHLLWLPVLGRLILPYLPAARWSLFQLFEPAVPAAATVSETLGSAVEAPRMEKKFQSGFQTMY